jgi:hypothetical protein
MNSNADILKQLAAGDISADEAAARLRGKPAAEAGQPQRWLHVRVSDLETGRPKVNVNLPLSWVAFGLRIGAKYAPEVAGLDLEQVLADLKAGTSGRLVDVEDLEDGEHVEIFVD